MYVDGEIARCQKVSAFIANTSRKILGISILQDLLGVRNNYGYFPILVDAVFYGMTRDVLYEKFKANGIYARRYFYPLCSEFLTYRGLPSALYDNLPVADKIAQEVLWLPIFADLTKTLMTDVAYLLQELK